MLLRCIFGLFLFVAANAQRTWTITQTTQVNTTILQNATVPRPNNASSPDFCKSFANCTACASANCTWFFDQLCNVSTAIVANRSRDAAQAALERVKDPLQCLALPSAANLRSRLDNSTQNTTLLATAVGSSVSQSINNTNQTDTFRSVAVARASQAVRGAQNATQNATQNAAQFAQNASQAAQNATQNATQFARNTSQAALNSTQFAAQNAGLLASRVAQNASQAAQNASQIARNASQIAQNASQLAQNASRFAQNVTQNASQTTQIAIQNTSQSLQNSTQTQNVSVPIVAISTTRQTTTSLLKKGKKKAKKASSSSSSSRSSSNSASAASASSASANSQSQQDCEAKEDMPFMPHGGRWQNPATCAMIACNNGIINTTQCQPLICSKTENRTCDPTNKCQPIPCNKPLVARAQPVPLVAVAGSFGDCIAMGTAPALKHGETFKDKKTCFTYQCNNRVMTALACTSTVCNGQIKKCDPANDCKPAECDNTDCPAQGEFPFLRNNQTIYNPTTCDRYTCLNRVTIRESCLASVCTNGEAKPCDPTNNCKPQACSSGDFAPPVLLPGTYIAPSTTLLLDGTWLVPLPGYSSNWGMATSSLTTSEWVLPSIFSSDCGEHKHGSTWEDKATCSTLSCFNGLTTSTSSCLMTVCPNGRLRPCDPANNCLSTCW